MEICLFQRKCFSFIFIERSSPSIQMQLYWPRADDIFSEHNLYLFSSSCEICMLVKYQPLALDMKQQTGSKSGKEYIKTVYCHLTYLTYMQSESESEVAQLCLTLCDPMDCSLRGSSLLGTFQARVPEWISVSFSRVSSQPRDRTQVSHVVGRSFYCLSHKGSMQSTSCECQAGWNTSWNQDCQEKCQ